MSDLKAYVLFPGALKNPLYSGWLDHLTLPWEIVKDYDTNWLPPADAGIVITHNHYRWEELSLLRNATEKSSVPVLVLVDGILEYRNCFEHPDLAEGSMLQPVVGHKIACIGASQVRWLESWGNVGKCELVGLPRLDGFLQKHLDREFSPGSADLASGGSDGSESSFRVLVATARTPWFNEAQRTNTYRGIESVKSKLESISEVDGRKIQVQFRMSEELHSNLKAPGFVARPGSIYPILEKVDAVITTPSTLQLEAAILGLPVAVIDFHNRPCMTPMAWAIGHESQTEQVIRQLAAPEPPQMFTQNALLADALQCQEAAAPRMARLVETMVRCGKQARIGDSAISFPDRILEHPKNGFCAVQPSGARADLYPDNSVFQTEQLSSLQTELASALHEMGNYPEKYFRQRSANQRLRGYINWLRLLIRNRAATIEELSAALNQLKAEIADRPVKND